MEPYPAFGYDAEEDGDADNSTRGGCPVILMVYPPDGYDYGFPKPWNPKIHPKVTDFLRAEGYPEELLAKGMAGYCMYEQLQT